MSEGDTAPPSNVALIMAEMRMSQAAGPIKEQLLIAARARSMGDPDWAAAIAEADQILRVQRFVGWVFAELAVGTSITRLVREHPYVTRAMILACYAWAADLTITMDSLE